MIKSILNLLLIFINGVDHVRCKAFTLLELMISITIVFILASTIALNFDEFKQTAEQEAQRIAMYLAREMRKVDREHDELVILFDNADKNLDSFTLARLYGKGTDTIKINSKTYYKETPFELSSSCKISSPEEKIFYKNHELDEAIALTVTDSLKRTCDLEISSVGRVFVRQEKI